MESGLEELNQGIADTIKECRKEAGLSQKDLAQMIGADQSLISRLESTFHEGYNLTTLYRIFNKMNIDIEIQFHERE